MSSIQQPSRNDDKQDDDTFSNLDFPTKPNIQAEPSVYDTITGFNPF
ncbi:17813_t:CDS:2 [Funneliformis geosporum]|uniref:14284_t:CDS:1 n=1 Tax=Funneliformis geosporum TaxID=1117311 RepID=A0A9W4WIF0_9GLOM|nr:17813_t:CDS:2 [Funneliformis geosporum]CAI2164133.1 14284_t:CDS:2 [Funneliformis geosporum]